MVYHLAVSFGRAREYSFRMSENDLADSTPEEARRWLDRQFAELGCEVTSPTGKVLIIDKIIGVARNGGEQRFIDGKAWAADYARNVTLALGRDTIRVDVDASTVGV